MPNNGKKEKNLNASNQNSGAAARKQLRAQKLKAKQLSSKKTYRVNSGKFEHLRKQVAEFKKTRDEYIRMQNRKIAQEMAQEMAKQNNEAKSKSVIEQVNQPKPEAEIKNENAVVIEEPKAKEVPQNEVVEEKVSETLNLEDIKIDESELDDPALDEELEKLEQEIKKEEELKAQGINPESVEGLDDPELEKELRELAQGTEEKLEGDALEEAFQKLSNEVEGEIKSTHADNLEVNDPVVNEEINRLEQEIAADAKANPDPVPVIETNETEKKNDMIVEDVKEETEKIHPAENNETKPRGEEKVKEPVENSEPKLEKTAPQNNAPDDEYVGLQEMFGGISLDNHNLTREQQEYVLEQARKLGEEKAKQQNQLNPNFMFEQWNRQRMQNRNVGVDPQTKSQGNISMETGGMEIPGMLRNSSPITFSGSTIDQYADRYVTRDKALLKERLEQKEFQDIDELSGEEAKVISDVPQNEQPEQPAISDEERKEREIAFAKQGLEELSKHRGGLAEDNRDRENLRAYYQGILDKHKTDEDWYKESLAKAEQKRQEQKERDAREKELKEQAENSGIRDIIEDEANRDAVAGEENDTNLLKNEKPEQEAIYIPDFYERLNKRFGNNDVTKQVMSELEAIIKSAGIEDQQTASDIAELVYFNVAEGLKTSYIEGGFRPKTRDAVETCFDNADTALKLRDDIGLSLEERLVVAQRITNVMFKNYSVVTFADHKLDYYAEDYVLKDDALLRKQLSDHYKISQDQIEPMMQNIRARLEGRTVNKQGEPDAVLNPEVKENNAQGTALKQEPAPKQNAQVQNTVDDFFGADDLIDGSKLDSFERKLAEQKAKEAQAKEEQAKKEQAKKEQEKKVQGQPIANAFDDDDFIGGNKPDAFERKLAEQKAKEDQAKKEQAKKEQEKKAQEKKVQGQPIANAFDDDDFIAGNKPDAFERKLAEQKAKENQAKIEQAKKDQEKKAQEKKAAEEAAKKSRRKR